MESRNHVLLEGEPAWDKFLGEIHDFVSPGVPPPVAAHGLTASERAVLQLVAQGLDNRTIAQRLGKGEKTVRNQVSIIFDKLGVRTRAEAIVRVRDHSESG